MPANTILSSDELFNKDVFELLGISDVAADKRQAMLTSMTKIIEGRVMARILDALTPAERQQLEQASDANYNQVMKECLAAHQLTVEEISAEESVMLKLELTGVSQSKTAK